MTAVASTLEPSVLVYREDQRFTWWIYAIVLGTAAFLSMIVHEAGWLPRMNIPGLFPVAQVIGLGCLGAMLAGSLRMTTVVDGLSIRVQFGVIPWSSRAIALPAIRRVRIARYRVVRDLGFWGIRRSRRGIQSYTARGDWAVLIILEDGNRVLIGSQQPVRLARAIRSGIVPQPS